MLYIIVCIDDDSMSQPMDLSTKSTSKRKLEVSFLNSSLMIVVLVFIKTGFFKTAQFIVHLLERGYGNN